MAKKVIDYISGKEVSAIPEELYAVQPFVKILIEDYNYPKEMIQAHPQVRVKAHPSDKKGYPIDIAVFEKNASGKKTLKMIVETKIPTRTDGLEQLKIYLKFSEAQIGIWFNGETVVCIKKIEKSGSIEFEEIPTFPKSAFIKGPI